MKKYKIVNGKKIPRSRKKRRNYIRNWKKQTRKPMGKNDVLMFGKYRLKKVSEIESLDPPYYTWLTKTFEMVD